MVQALRTEGVDVPDELLTYVSPLSWEDTRLMRDDVWRPKGVPAEDVYRALGE